MAENQVTTDTTRYMIHCEKRGAYLGSGFWSNEPAGKAVNSIPTYTLVEMAAQRGGNGLNFKQFPDHTDSKQELELRWVSPALIDMLGRRVSEKVAVDHLLVDSPWTDKGEV